MKVNIETSSETLVRGYRTKRRHASENPTLNGRSFSTDSDRVYFLSSNAYHLMTRRFVQCCRGAVQFTEQ
jgi:hypothetical protein